MCNIEFFVNYFNGGGGFNESLQIDGNPHSPQLDRR